ncbi:hypothetical protein NEMBOFW57_009471 [Staphylotrichum longicolle]|uniref:Uncharacterized protein n=1 Tax=Staphylotrichum longicolle TaxID=669026 RepID=A0AAD4EPF3_9PEZI|nr:hypothetical protein NEMBOFW57_009471 [Staphylotrichum longicolle]
MVPNMRRSAMDTPKAQATRLRRDFDDLISKLIDDENTARSDYEREVPQLEQQICEKEEAIERIQREIEVGRNRIIQLRDAIRDATEVRREVEAIFRCRSESKVGRVKFANRRQTNQHPEEGKRGTPINQNGDRRKRRHQPRTIQFSKVFQRGGAKYKHLIVEHPEEPGI